MLPRLSWTGQQKAYRPALTPRCRHANHPHPLPKESTSWFSYYLLALSRSHACAFGFLLIDNHYSAFHRDSSQNHQYKRTASFNTMPSKFHCLATIHLHTTHKQNIQSHSVYVESTSNNESPNENVLTDQHFNYHNPPHHLTVISIMLLCARAYS